MEKEQAGGTRMWPIEQVAGIQGFHGLGTQQPRAAQCCVGFGLGKKGRRSWATLPGDPSARFGA